MCSAVDGRCDGIAAVEALVLASPFQALMATLRSNGDLVSGAVGGPLVVGLLTPQRNAMTLAAKDTSSSFCGMYKQVFKAGLLHGWRGGSGPTMAAVPQFTAIGPVYLLTERYLGNPLGPMFLASLFESSFSFAAQRRNAQIQYNATVPVAQHVPHHPSTRLISAGFVPHVLRNAFAMAGIRCFAPHSYGLVTSFPGVSGLDDGTRLVLSDLASSIVAATISMPFNHMFSWSACTPELDSMSYARRARCVIVWMANNYREKGLPLLGRDVMIRINYTAFLFTGYRFLERSLTE